MTCMRRRPQEHRKEHRNRMKKARGTAKANIGAAKSELKVRQQKESRFFSDFICGDYADLFQRINKLRTLKQTNKL